MMLNWRDGGKVVQVGGKVLRDGGKVVQPGGKVLRNGGKHTEVGDNRLYLGIHKH